MKISQRKNLSNSLKKFFSSKAGIAMKKKLSKMAKGKEPWNKGKTGIYSKESLMKMSKAMLGKPSPRKGVKCSLKTRKRISDSTKGRVAWNKGKKIKDTEKIKEGRKKQAKSLKKRWKNPTKKMLNGIKNGALCRKGKKYPNISKALKGKKTMVNTIMKNNGINPGGNKKSKKGKYYSIKNKSYIYYDSSWELKAYKILDERESVKSYSRCNFYVEYKWEGDIHRYIPDIKVIHFDESIDIIEVKPLIFLLRDRKVRAKGRSANKYCKENDMCYLVWTESCLRLK